MRAKIHGERLEAPPLESVVSDIAAGAYSDINLAAFLTACAGDRLDRQEMIDLTRAMIASGERLRWERRYVVLAAYGPALKLRASMPAADGERRAAHTASRFSP